MKTANKVLTYVRRAVDPAKMAGVPYAHSFTDIDKAIGSFAAGAGLLLTCVVILIFP